MLEHIHHARNFAGAILLSLLTAHVAPAQTIANAPPVRVQIVSSNTSPGGTLTSETVILEAKPAGKFSVVLKGPELVTPAGCTFSSDAALDASIQRAGLEPLSLKSMLAQNAGTKIEGAISPDSEGRFRVSLTIAITSLSCRQVGELVIPAFPKTTLNKDVTVENGEELTLSDTGEGAPLKFSLTFTAEPPPVRISR